MSTPKFYVKTQYHHPAIVSTPVLLGVKDEEHETETRNAITGEVVGHQ